MCHSKRSGVWLSIRSLEERNRQARVLHFGSQYADDIKS